MKLALVTHNVNRGDGQGRVNYEIARYALQQGCQVWLLANWVEPDLKEMGATWIPLRPRRWPMYLPVVMEFVGLANRAVDHLSGHVDVVHAFGYVLTRPHQVNTSQFVHSAWQRSPEHDARARRDWYGAYQWLYTALNARWEQRAYRQARIVVAASEMVRHELLDIGVSEACLRVITNAVDPEEFRPGIQDRAALNLPGSVPLALFVGDIRSSRKNLETVLRALVEAPGVHLAVVGAVDGSPYPTVVRRLGLADRVHFMGFRSDVAAVMRAVDVFIFLSRYEPFGMVLLEAMATGLPVITARSVGAAPLVTPEAGIVLTEAGDVEGAGVALKTLLHSSRRAEMGRAARCVAEAHSWQRMAASYLALYQELAAKPAGYSYS